MLLYPVLTLVFYPNCLSSSQIALPTFQRLAQNTSGHLTAKQFQDLFEVLDGRGTRCRHRPAMSYVQHPLLRKIQILVSNKCFDYAGDFVAAVNVLLVSVSSVLFTICRQGNFSSNPMDWRTELEVPSDMKRLELLLCPCIWRLNVVDPPSCPQHFFSLNPPLPVASIPLGRERHFKSSKAPCLKLSTRTWRPVHWNSDLLIQNWTH